MRILRWAALALAPTLFLACGDKAEDALKDAGAKFVFKGTVTKAGKTEPVEGANVRAIKLANQEAIDELVIKETVPDGAGGSKQIARIDFTKVDAYATDVTAVTDANGQFQLDAPLDLYLLYVYGPEGFEPTKANGYSPDFRGIDPDTGELNLDNLIGKDGKQEQTFDDLQLAGGPQPPPPPSATPAPPEPPPAPPAEAPVADPDPPAQPVAGDPAPEPADDNPETLDPPVPTAAWTAIDLKQIDGTAVAGTAAGSFQVADATLAAGSSYFELTGTLAAEQTAPVYLVMQVGLDPQRVTDCASVTAAPKSYVYQVEPVGTAVTYKFVPPGPYYRVFFAQTAAKDETTKVVTTENESDMIIVGNETCEDAVPERPFLATLTWDKVGDVDIHVFKHDLAKVKADDLAGSVVDVARWTRRNGDTLSLDVDNVRGFGPENNGEAATVTPAVANGFCYSVMVQLYSARSDNLPVTATVDVIHVVEGDAAAKTVTQQRWSKALEARKQWELVGVWGADADCQKLAAAE